jgi:hypothetical protein
MVGHATESIYKRYAIIAHAMLQEAAAKLDTYAGAPEPTEDATIRRFNR